MKDGEINFGSRVFKVEIVDKLLAHGVGKLEKVQGEIDHAQCTIRIEKNINEQSMVLTLFHEIVHHLIGRVNQDDLEVLNPKFEEALVENLSEGMMMVLRLNPWIADEVKELDE